MSGARGLVLVAAGGTGGHLFPASALAGILTERGYTVDLVTDERADQYGISFPARRIHQVPADTIRGRSPLSLARTFWKLGRGFLKCIGIIRRERPLVVVGFGGYPTLPPIFAAWARRVPAILHEQNSVMGRANRLLARRVDKIATSFPKVAKVRPEDQGKLVHVGVPVREPVIAARETPYDPPGVDGAFRLLVFGGSQGAKVFSDTVPGAIVRLDETVRGRLRIVQQCRAEDLDRVRFAYDAIDVEAELAPFFRDLPARIADAHLVIARSGASTVAELSCIGAPSLLVPLPHALDNDQLMNASALAARGGAVVMDQRGFTAHTLADKLAALMDDPAALAEMAGKAHAFGKPDAAQALADLVETLTT